MLASLVEPAQHAEGVLYYYCTESWTTQPLANLRPPAALALSPTDIAALNKAPANKVIAAVKPGLHYYYDSNKAGAARVIGGLSTGANSPCYIHWAARPAMYGGRRKAHAKLHIFEIDDTAGYWAALGLDAQVDNNPIPGHATIFIKDAAADAHLALGGKDIAYANGQFGASAAKWAPKLAALAGPCR